MTKTNLSLSDASLDTIEQLKDTTEAVTTAEVVRRALEFYRLAVEQQKAGAKIVFKDPKGTENAVIIL